MTSKDSLASNETARLQVMRVVRVVRVARLVIAGREGVKERMRVHRDRGTRNCERRNDGRKANRLQEERVGRPWAGLAIVASLVLGKS